MDRAARNAFVTAAVEEAMVRGEDTEAAARKAFREYEAGQDQIEALEEQF